MTNSLLQSEVEQHQLPTLSVIATRNGEEIVSFGFGTTEPSGDQQVNGNTRFGIASITKLVTAIQLLLICEERRLSLDDLVATHFPDWAFAAQSSIRIRHLLSHSSGLPGLDSRFNALNLDDQTDQTGSTDAAIKNQKAELLSPDDLVQYLNNQAICPVAEPGQLLNYSNESFCLAGGIIEKRLGLNYAQATSQSVFKPLGMEGSFIGSPASVHKQNIAFPLIADNTGFKQTPFWDAPLFYPAGGAVSSARDLVKLFSVLGRGHTFLSDNAKTTLLTPHMQVPSRPASGSAYGVGLEIQQLCSEFTLYWHSGQRTGIASFAGFIPQADLAVAVLCNLANAPVAAIAFKLIAALLNRPDITWPPTPESLPINNSSPPGYSGLYLNDENIALNVVSRNGKYYLRDDTLSDDDEKQMEPLIFLGPSHGNVAGQSFCFLKHQPSDTQPWAIALDLRILERLKQ